MQGAQKLAAALPFNPTKPGEYGAASTNPAPGAGFTSFREPIQDDKVRGKPERFADHYTQATLFWNSQTPIEQAHIIRGFRFELTRVQVPAIRARVVSMLANVNSELAERLAEELGMDLPGPMPKAAKSVFRRCPSVV